MFTHTHTQRERKRERELYERVCVTKIRLHFGDDLPTQKHKKKFISEKSIYS